MRSETLIRITFSLAIKLRRERERESMATTATATATMKEESHSKHGGENGEGCERARTAETLMRVVPIGLCLTALVMMLRDSESNDYGSLSYSDLGAFRYLVHVNGICAGYSLLSAVILVMPRPPTMSRAWTFFLLDQVLTYATLAAGAVSTEVLYLSYKGDEATAWSAACASFGGFCRKATVSVAMTLAAVACYVALSLLSSYRLFSRFDAPVACSGKGVEIPAFQG
ncbi:CASP-like protein 2A1 [Rhodamnia argentea]|uniref:CASP-like protein n=1 Tax=Rhodamnia argentea TaxID=178133 RepID=A0A8B8NS67_9MYRT|nr:CASP-like protein 2A1 [Rhodamnia argentea]